MFCHGPYAGDAWAMVVSGRRVVHCRRPPRHGSFLSARLHSGLPAAGPPAAEPCFARNVRARPCAFRGGAPDCACARARGADARPLGSPFGAVSWHVMFCHGPYAGDAWAMVVSGRRVVHCRRPPRHGSFLSIRLHSGLPAAGPPAAEPCFARNVRARPCAFRGGAPDCACARARERRTPGARLPQTPVVHFFAPARNGRRRGPADAVPRLPSRSYHGFSGVKP